MVNGPLRPRTAGRHQKDYIAPGKSVLRDGGYTGMDTDDRVAGDIGESLAADDGQGSGKNIIWVRNAL